MSLKLGFDVEDVFRANRVDRKDVEVIQEGLKREGYSNLSDEQVVQFLISCENDLEFTKTTVKCYFRHRHQSPDLFCERSFENPELLANANLAHLNIIPKRSKDNSAIILYKLVDPDPTNFSMSATAKALTMMLDTAIYNNPPDGLIIMVDINQMCLTHLLKAKIGVCRRFINYLQEGLPVKLKAIHVINAVYLVDKFVSFVKPLMKPTLRSMIFTHAKPFNQEYFFENCVERECLPKDYGGDLKSSEELHLATVEAMKRLYPFFEAEELQRAEIFENADVC